MTWIKADISFDDHAAIFYLDHRMAMLCGLARAVGLWSDQPERIEKVLYDLLLKHHPHLVGAQVLVLQFSMTERRWKMLVAHRDFASRPLGGLPEEFPLVPDPAPPTEVSA